MRPLLASLFAILVLAGQAVAHPFLQDAMWVLFEPGRVRVAVNVSVKEITVAQGVDGTISVEALSGPAERHRDYLLKHLTLSTGGRPLPGKITNVTAPPEITEPEKTFYQYELDYTLGDARPPEITFSHGMLREFSYAIGTAWDVSYAVRIKRAGSDEVTTGLLLSRQPKGFHTGWEADPATGRNDGWRTFRDYLAHGVMHILTGYDHLLFIGALVLATLGFWEMAKVVGTFTVAHTLTLSLSAFDIVRLPPWVVEPVIAASIIFVAVENIVSPQRAHSWLRLGVAFGFGLIHGLGFAGGLRDAMSGLPAAGTWLALGAFSIGVEVGHQAVVLPLFGLLALGRGKLREGFNKSALRWGSAAISACGAYYLFVSVHGQLLSR